MKATLLFLLFFSILVLGCNNQNTETSTQSPQDQMVDAPKNDIKETLQDPTPTTPLEQKPNTSVKEALKNPESLYIEPGFPKEIAIQFLFFKLLVEEENKSEIAKLIDYPLKRPNTLLKDSGEFIAYYDNIFDANLKKKLQEVTLGQKDFIIKSDHYGVLGGMLWFNRHSGEITSLRYQSEQEKEAESLQKTSVENRDHPSIAGWEKAIVRCETENFTVYILQDSEYELSYVSWNKPKTSADEPNLILQNGVTKRHGTMGGSTYSFKNGIWTYAIDERRLGPDGTNGYFLQVFKNGNLVKEEKALKVIE